MVTYIYGIFQTVWYVLLCNLFLEIFEEKKFLKRIVVYGLWASLVVVDYLTSAFLANEILLKQLLIILFTSVAMRVRFNQKYIRILILTLLYQASCIVIEYTTFVMVKKCFSEIIAELLISSVISSLIGILCQMITFCLILIMKKYFVQNVSVSLTEIEWVRFSIFPIFTIISILAMIINFDVVQNEQQGNILICIACGMLVMNVMIFYLINDIIKREIQISESRLFQEKIKNETEMYHTVSENYEKQRKKVHEFNNHMSCILALAQKGESDKLRSYLEGMQADIMHSLDYIDTNHTLVNAILNSKYQEVKEKGITFVFKVNDLSNIILSDEDIVVMLSNLLNNAFEACEQCKEKIIRLKFVQEEKQIILSVVNTYSKIPIRSGDKFRTTKEDTELHGIGIENVKDTVEKYSGTYVIKYQENLFKFVIMIPK